MWRNSRVRVGLDIGTESVRAVVVRREGRGWAFANAGEVPLESGEDDHDPIAVSAAAAELLEQLSVRRATIATAVSANDAVVERLELPSVTPRAAWALVRTHFETRRPFHGTPCRLGWSPPAPSRPRRLATVIAVAARAAAVEDRVAVLAQAGYRPTVIGVEPLALANAADLAYPERGGCTLIVHIKRRTALCCLVDADGFAASGEVPLAGSRASAPAADVAAFAARHATRSGSDGPPASPVHVLLSGDENGAAMLVRDLETATGRPVELFDPLRRLPRAADSHGPQRLSPSFVVALGLAAGAGEQL